jgi:hypothetical protein
MPGAFLERDLSAVFNTADFAHSASVTRAGVYIATVNGIYDDGNDTVNGDGQSKANMTRAVFTCATSANILIGDQIEVAGLVFIARLPEKDGTGVTKWNLKLA